MPTLRKRGGRTTSRRWPERAGTPVAAFGAEGGSGAEIIAAFGALAGLQMPATLALGQVFCQEQQSRDQLDDDHEQQCSDEG